MSGLGLGLGCSLGAEGGPQEQERRIKCNSECICCAGKTDKENVECV